MLSIISRTLVNSVKSGRRYLTSTSSSTLKTSSPPPKYTCLSPWVGINGFNSLSKCLLRLAESKDIKVNTIPIYIPFQKRIHQIMNGLYG